MAPHAGIVGAGVAGLRCATVLLDHGYDVTIMEARNRVGGRVRQSRSTSDCVSIDPLADCPKRSDGAVGGRHVSERPTTTFSLLKVITQWSKLGT